MHLSAVCKSFKNLVIFVEVFLLLEWSFKQRVKEFSSECMILIGQINNYSYSALNLGQIKTNPISLAQLVQELRKKEKERVRILALKTIGFCTLTLFKAIGFSSTKVV